MFSERLRILRFKNSVSQVETAEKIGVSPRAYQDYEYGKFEPTLSVLIRIADFFNVSLDYLAGRSENPRRR